MLGKSSRKEAGLDKNTLKVAAIKMLALLGSVASLFGDIGSNVLDRLRLPFPEAQDERSAGATHDVLYPANGLLIRWD